MKTNKLFEQLISKQDLTPVQMQDFLEACTKDQLTDIQIATFLALMRTKGESTSELNTAAHFLNNLAHKINLETDAIDIVGTGGDGQNTFNISTAASFVIAASGTPVAKHGNRSVSSRCGSADLLEQAGFILTGSEKDMKSCIKTHNLAFLFAPNFHPAMQKVRAARQQLGIRTLFNLLGPLINPAQVKRQVVGVFSPALLNTLSQVLISLGSQRHLVLSSQDGLDEISIAAPTDVLEYKDGKTNNFTINPETYGLKHNNLSAIIVDSPQQSLSLIEQVFVGSKGPARDIIVLNAAAAIYCAKENESYESAIQLAQQTIDSGKAADLFANLRQLTQTFNKE